MSDFENKSYEGIYYTRFIMSWVRSGGSLTVRSSWRFEEWLRTLTINDKKIPENVIGEIMFLATNGKMELEDSAYEYLKAQ